MTTMFATDSAVIDHGYVMRTHTTHITCHFRYSGEFAGFGSELLTQRCQAALRASEMARNAAMAYVWGMQDSGASPIDPMMFARWYADKQYSFAMGYTNDIQAIQSEYQECADTLATLTS